MPEPCLLTVYCLDLLEELHDGVSVAQRRQLGEGGGEVLGVVVEIDGSHVLPELHYADVSGVGEVAVETVLAAVAGLGLCLGYQIYCKLLEFLESAFLKMHLYS